MRDVEKDGGGGVAGRLEGWRAGAVRDDGRGRAGGRLAMRTAAAWAQDICSKPAGQQVSWRDVPDRRELVSWRCEGGDAVGSGDGDDQQIYHPVL